MDDKRMQEYAKYLQRKPYRNLSPIEQGVKLCEEYGASNRGAAKAVGTSEGAIRRAKTALKKKRNVGVDGRPRNLTPYEEQELARRVQESIDQKTPLTFKKFQAAVCVTLP